MCSSGCLFISSVLYNVGNSSATLRVKHCAVHRADLVSGRMHLCSRFWCWSSICRGFGSCWSRASSSAAAWRASTRRTASGQCSRSTVLAITSPSITQSASASRHSVEFASWTHHTRSPTTPDSEIATTNRPVANSSAWRNRAPRMKNAVSTQPSCLSRTCCVDLGCGLINCARAHWRGLKWQNGLQWLRNFFPWSCTYIILKWSAKDVMVLYSYTTVGSYLCLFGLSVLRKIYYKVCKSRPVRCHTFWPQSIATLLADIKNCHVILLRGVDVEWYKEIYTPDLS